MSLILVSSERFADHLTPPGHPERPERAQVMSASATRWQSRGGEVVAPRAATDEQLARVHDEQYLRYLAGIAGRATALDPDTYTSPDSHDVSLLAAGAVIDAVERVMQKGSQTPSDPSSAAFALVRPPGHHAERGKAMGFCLYNNVAIGAAHARALGAGRVAIVDFDVHHGNGTQHTFESDPDVLYVSTHQFPFYPGTGAAQEIGRGKGEGFTVNLPLEAGSVSEDYKLVFEEVIVPVLEQYKPSLLFVSAGFDAHERDPIAGMRLTTEVFPAMASELRRIAEKCCDGRMVLVTEGGYDLQALNASMDGVIGALTAAKAEVVWPASGVASSRGRASANATKKALSPFWKL